MLQTMTSLVFLVAIPTDSLSWVHQVLHVNPSLSEQLVGYLTEHLVKQYSYLERLYKVTVLQNVTVIPSEQTIPTCAKHSAVSVTVLIALLGELVQSVAINHST